MQVLNHKMYIWLKNNLLKINLLVINFTLIIVCFTQNLKNHYANTIVPFLLGWANKILIALCIINLFVDCVEELRLQCQTGSRRWFLTWTWLSHRRRTKHRQRTLRLSTHAAFTCDAIPSDRRHRCVAIPRDVLCPRELCSCTRPNAKPTDWRRWRLASANPLDPACRLLAAAKVALKSKRVGGGYAGMPRSAAAWNHFCLSDGRRVGLFQCVSEPRPRIKAVVNSGNPPVELHICCIADKFADQFILTQIQSHSSQVRF